MEDFATAKDTARDRYQRRPYQVGVALGEALPETESFDGALIRTALFDGVHLEEVRIKLSGTQGSSDWNPEMREILAESVLQIREVRDLETATEQLAALIEADRREGYISMIGRGP